VVAPDLFNGTPANLKESDPNFDLQGFMNAHGPSVTEPLIDVAVKYLKETFGARKVIVSH
jgi:hypothetical protein